MTQSLTENPMFLGFFFINEGVITISIKWKTQFRHKYWKNAEKWYIRIYWIHAIFS